MKINDKVQWRQIFSIKSIFFLLLGVLSAVFAFKGFMIPNQFVDGGVTGMSVLISQFFEIDLIIPIIVLNVFFLILGYSKISKTFAVQSLLAIILLAICLKLVDVPTITRDKVLSAIFGGFLIGLGIGCVIRSGGVLDGFEIIGLYSTKKSQFSKNEIMLVLASLLFISLGIIYGWDKAMYSIITYFTGSRTSSYIVDGIEEYTALNIVSKEYDKIKELIVKDFGKAITVYKGERGYLPNSFHMKEDCDVIVTVVTRLEIFNLQNAIYQIDPQAFLFTQSIKEVKGGIVKQIKNH